ncbi:helix-turn-helix transcriptional regulator [Streptomyces sp. ISL-10]|uniref:helix-turn-helix domain-containing protein n=1 Tax=Streptomyces sp. ISL-10 TaxID=2819172 RepID=UPI001BE8F9ED|nr:helix-turn-helix transcriptional regulator [Streptomyces sp. ISL-10]MBT2366281.1 helix-turn-helix transcriptional regulator [Streptomyces sp. ISL-10]
MPRVPPPDPQLLARRRRVGDRIRAARLYANLTQQAVAERSGMDRSGFQKIEHGTVSPTLDSLLRIADAIGVPLADLVRE